jgi:hypothetical protein
MDNPIIRTKYAMIHIHTTIKFHGEPNWKIAFKKCKGMIPRPVDKIMIVF